MTDLVIRLRYGIEQRNDTSLRELCLESADEIEKLRAQVVALQSSLDAGPPKPGKKTPDALGENR